MRSCSNVPGSCILEKLLSHVRFAAAVLQVLWAIKSLSTTAHL